MANGINVDWLPGYDRPSLNTWYRHKRLDDWYKIVKAGRDTVNNATLYNVVAYRSGKTVFESVTLKQARAAIQIETIKIYNYGG